MKKKITMEYYIDCFLRTSYIKNKKSTYSTYSYTIYKRIYPYFKDYTKDNINQGVILQFISELSSSGLKNKSIRDILILLKEIFKYSGISIDIPYPKLIKKRISIFTNEDQRKLEEYLLQNISPVHLGIYLSLYTGIRIGELCALSMDHVDLYQGKILIDKTLVRVQRESSKKKRCLSLILLRQNLLFERFLSPRF